MSRGQLMQGSSTVYTVWVVNWSATKTESLLFHTKWQYFAKRVSNPYGTYVTNTTIAYERFVFLSLQI